MDSNSPNNRGIQPNGQTPDDLSKRPNLRSGGHSGSNRPTSADQAELTHQMSDENPYGCQPFSFVAGQSQQQINKNELLPARPGQLNKQRSQSSENKYKRGDSLKNRENKYKKVNAHEKFEEMRFTCHDFEQKLKSNNQIFEEFTASKQLDEMMKSNDQQEGTVQIPIELLRKIQQNNAGMQNEFQKITTQLNDYFDEQQEENQRYRGKSKHYKRKLKGLENQSILLQKDQREFEQSLKDITKEHHLQTNKMSMVYDQMETQVSQLKNTRHKLTLSYKENQLDQAVKEMINFYNNLENQNSNDEYEGDSINLDKVFFIKPTEDIQNQITMRLQQSQSELRASRAQSQMKISNRPLSIERNDPSRSNNRTPHIPPLPLHHTGEDFTNEDINDRYHQTQIQEPQIISQQNKQQPENKNLTEQEKDDQILRNMENPQREQDVIITNPVMLNAMPLPESAFDHGLEEDGANCTLDMKTERLRQFPEEYEMLQHIEDSDQRIIMKQYVFLQYEGILRKQAKQEKKKRKQIKKQKQLELQQEQERLRLQQDHGKALVETTDDQTINIKPVQIVRNSHVIQTDTSQSYKINLGGNQNNQGHYTQTQTPTNAIQGKNKNPGMVHQSSVGSLHGGAGQGSSASSVNGYKPMQQRNGIGGERNYEPNEYTGMVSSQISFHSELPAMDTKQQFSAMKRENMELVDVNQSELMNVEFELIHGLKTATEKSLIEHIDREYQQKEQLVKELRDEEKKKILNYSSTQHSKFSLLGKQISQGSLGNQQPLLKQYASNNSNAMLIANDCDTSMLSERRRNGKHQDRNALELLNVDVNLEKLPSLHDNSFYNNDINKQLNSGSKSNSFSEIMNNPAENRNKMGDNFLNRNKSEQIFEPVNESFLSAPSQYQRMFEQDNSVTQSPLQIQNSYVQSDQSNQQIKQETSNNQDEYIDAQQQMIYAQQIQLQQEGQNLEDYRQKLPLDVIHERQSEFSQSMMTNAARLNSHRSKGSKNNNHYTNNSGAAGHQKGSSVVLSVRTTDHNNSSSRRTQKGNTSENLGRSQNEPASGSIQTGPRPSTEIEDCRNYIVRCNSQTESTRNAQNNYKDLDSKNEYFASFQHNNQQMQISKRQNQGSRNQYQKISKSSNEIDQKKESSHYENIKKQPQVRKKQQLKNFESDVKKLMPSLNIPSAEKNQKSGNPHQIPPLGKIKSHGTDQNKKNSVNLTLQNSQLNSEREHIVMAQQQQYQPHSHRSHIGGGESMRERSYFDESPAIFEHAESALDPSASRIRGGLDDALPIQSSTNEVHSHVNAEEDSNSQQQFNSGVHSNFVPMQSIPQSSLLSINSMIKMTTNQQSQFGQTKDSLQILTRQISPTDPEDDEKIGQISEKKAAQRPGLVRSSSECNLRDNAFYEMCDDEDEIAMYCKYSEQNILDAIHVRNLSGLNKQDSSTVTDNQFLQKANQSSGVSNNQLVFMSQRTFYKICGKYLQTQDKTELAPPINQLSSQHIGETVGDAVDQTKFDQNSSQQQTRGKSAFQSRLLASINANNGLIPQQMHNGLGTNLFTNSLEDQSTMNLHQQLMMPTHQYNRRTLLMMQNLHNNYLYSANTGILFTMQRGYNSNYHKSTQDHGQSLKNLTNFGKNTSTGGVSGCVLTNTQLPLPNRIQGQNSTQPQGPLFKANDEPVNLTNIDPKQKYDITKLVMDAKQQNSDQMNVGSITIVDDDGKLMLDRKLLVEATSNHSSHQTNARRFSSSRVANGQVTTSDFSNLQTKQLGILRNNLAGQAQQQAERKLLEEECKEDNVAQPMKSGKSAKNSVQPTKKQDNRITNFFSGLKKIEIQQRQSNINQSQRSASDLSNMVTESQDQRKITKLQSTHTQQQNRKFETENNIKSAKNFRTISQTEFASQKSNIQNQQQFHSQIQSLKAQKLVMHGQNQQQLDTQNKTVNQNIESLKGNQKKTQATFRNMQNLKHMIKIQQQKNTLNLSQSIQMNNSSNLSHLLRQQNNNSCNQAPPQHLQLQVPHQQQNQEQNTQIRRLQNKSQPKTQIQKNQELLQKIKQQNMGQAGINQNQSHGNFMIKKGSLQDPAMNQGTLSSARNSSSSNQKYDKLIQGVGQGNQQLTAVYMNANGRLSIKKKQLLK